MLNRILDKFTYVKDLKMRIRQLEAMGHTLMIQKSEAVRNEREYKEKYRGIKKNCERLEAGFISMLEDSHMIYNNLQLDGKSVCIAFNRLKALRKTKEIKCSVMVGQDVVEFKTVLRGKADKE